MATAAAGAKPTKAAEPDVSFEEWKKKNKKVKKQKKSNSNGGIDLAETVVLSLCFLMVPLIIALVYIHTTGWRPNGDSQQPRFETNMDVEERARQTQGAEHDGNVVMLTAKVFPSIVLQPISTFALFYAPWCGHCQSFKPDWQALAAKYIGSTEVVIAQVNCDDERAICQMYGIESFPTLLYWVDGSAKQLPEKYQGERAPGAIADFAANRLGAGAAGKEL